MANELTVTAFVRASKGNFTHTSDVGQKQFDMATGSGGTPGVVSVTTSTATVNFGAVTPGVVWIRNLSTGSTIEFETTGSDSFAKLVPGMLALIPKAGDGWLVKASTAGGTSLVDIRSYST